MRYEISVSYLSYYTTDLSFTIRATIVIKQLVGFVLIEFLIPS